MEHRTFGSLAHTVSVVGQGTWYIDDGDRTEAIAALRTGLDLGMTHIDTAEMYGDAEDVVAAAIEGRRDQVFLVSKVLPDHASRRGTVLACEHSLARLGTDRLDVYLLHWRGRHPLEETVAAFEELKQAGKILAWGVSNFDVPDLEALLEVTRGARPVCNQVLYHLGERAIEHVVLPWCEAHNVAVVAYSPFGHGRFPGAHTKGGRLLTEIAEARGATPRQVALRFLLRHPDVFAIPKASTSAHATENAGVGSLFLTEAEIARVDRAFPRGPLPRALPMI